jgi:hypothetical protein
MKLLWFPFRLLIYFSLATVAAEAGALGTLWMKGRLDRERLFQLMAAAYDVDLYAVRTSVHVASSPIQQSQVSYEEVREARSAAGRDLDLRELAVEKGIQHFQRLQAMLAQERQRYQVLRTDFEERLEQQRQGAVDQSVLDVQRQLEAVSPALAKDQLVRLLDDPSLDPETARQFVVTIVKAMPLEKRKKILAEFKNEDAERLHDILRQIRLGVPAVQLIRQTRSQLQQFMTRNPT